MLRGMDGSGEEMLLMNRKTSYASRLAKGLRENRLLRRGTEVILLVLFVIDAEYWSRGQPLVWLEVAGMAAAIYVDLLLDRPEPRHANQQATSRHSGTASHPPGDPGGKPPNGGPDK